MSKLSAVVVGLNMGKAHVAAYADLPEYRLAAVCDLNAELANEIASQHEGCEVFTDYAEMLDKIKPDIVNVSTPNVLHCDMVVAAAESGARGVYCEKPIAMNLREARIMQNACETAGIPLAIGHQRRVSDPYATMRKAITDGLIGEVYLIKGICAGDFLSDGTHTIDSLLYLNGDCGVLWVLGQVYRGEFASEEEVKANRYAYTGKRFGHNVERGAISSFQLENGVRCETVSGGELLMPGRWYQDIEIFGKNGRIWRNNDNSDPAVMINTNGKWEALPLTGNTGWDSGLRRAHGLFAQTVLNGDEHPMSMKNAMKGFEVVMSIYESARLNEKIVLPLKQDEFPLDLMLRERGEIE
ncbi:MAG: Gfo/Idh/MocA family oxidoreductase [Defluviitaleaceae bacterium]|nr:Gfo/Idh/MocA family oxidoreductase [Defluviitaleaceae bacterium]